MKIPFPYGLFRPYVRPDDKLSDILVPIILMLIMAAVAAIPFFEEKGVWVGLLIFAGSFFVLLHARYMMVKLSGREGYLSPSLIGPTEAIVWFEQYRLLDRCPTDLGLATAVRTLKQPFFQKEACHEPQS